MEEPKSDRNKETMEASKGSQEIKCAKKRSLVLKIKRRPVNEFCREEEENPNPDQQKNKGTPPDAAAKLKSCSVKLEKATCPEYGKDFISTKSLSSPERLSKGVNPPRDQQNFSSTSRGSMNNSNPLLINWSATVRRRRTSFKSRVSPDENETRWSCLSLDEDEAIDALLMLHAYGHLFDKKNQLTCTDGGAGMSVSEIEKAEQVSGSPVLPKKRCQTEDFNSDNTVVRLEKSRLVEQSPKEDTHSDNVGVRFKRSKTGGERWISEHPKQGSENSRKIKDGHFNQNFVKSSTRRKVSDVCEDVSMKKNEIKCNQNTTLHDVYGCPTNNRLAPNSGDIFSRKAVSIIHYDQIPVSSKSWICIDCKKSFSSSAALGGHRSSCKVKNSMHTCNVERGDESSQMSDSRTKTFPTGHGLGEAQSSGATASPQKVNSKEMSPTSPLDMVDSEVRKNHNGMHFDLNELPPPELSN